MKWVKKGLIFCAAGQRTWMQTHTAVPIPLKLDGDYYRVYFGTRDKQNRAHIGYVEFDLKSPATSLRVSEDYVLGPGPPGFFDDNGVHPGCIVEHEQKLYMYYLGRNNGDRPLYYMAIGLAVSDDYGKTFRRLFNAPILTRSEFDPWMVSTPFVMREEGVWRMWYLSGLKWERVNEVLHSFYHIKYAQSVDGLNWKREGKICIPLQEDEMNIASPAVLKEDGLYKMWYSYAGSQQYRIGYAESLDGNDWTRKDAEVGINLSSSGWDSEAMAYPYVFKHGNQKYLLYSGNGFGRGGFGLACEDNK